MSSQAVLRVPVDQLTSSTADGLSRRPRWGQFAMAAPALLLGLAAWRAGGTLTTSSAALLTATSILTGATFSMAVVFWNKSIDARRDPRLTVSSKVLSLLDRVRTHLIYTVMIGAGAVGLLVVNAIFGEHLKSFSGLLVAVTSGMVFYLITLFVASLRYFNQAFFVLKA